MNPRLVTQHERAGHPRVPAEDCWYCQRRVAHCKSKIAFKTGADAFDWALDMNIEREWQGRLVLPYRCPVCDGYHLRTARSRHDMRKVEGWRRKVLRGRFAC